MTFKETEFDGLIEVIPQIHSDNRGLFLEAFHESKFKEAGITHNFVQDNQSFSKKGTIRGLHLQLPPYAQDKYVRVLKGKVLDIAVDLRKDSKTFGKVFSQVLDDQSQKGLIVPGGFAHGFSALEDTIFYYKCTGLYHKESEAGIHWNDSTLAIDWKVEKPIISEKDDALPSFDEFLNKFIRLEK